MHEKDGVVTKTEYLNDSQSLTGYSQVLRQTETVDDVVTKTISYIIGHQRISQTVESETENVTHFFTFDGHGSTRVLLDATAAMVQLYAFDAYGNAIGFNVNRLVSEPLKVYDIPAVVIFPLGVKRWNASKQSYVGSMNNSNAVSV